MPRGGARQGAGRKPKTKKRAVVLGMDGARMDDAPPPADLPPALSDEDRDGLLTPPKGLPRDAKRFWTALAPHALEERTLTPATEAGFRELCIRMMNVQALDRRIARLGIASQDALPYMRERRGQASQMNAALKDFKLSAFGKPATAETPAPREGGNEWAAFGGGAS